MREREKGGELVPGDSFFRFVSESFSPRNDINEFMISYFRPVQCQYRISAPFSRRNIKVAWQFSLLLLYGAANIPKATL